MTRHILSYFGIMGRAEPIRLTFVQAQLPFTNKAVEFAEFTELKPTLPCGQLPVLEIEDEETGSKTMMDQSNAIMRYVGKLGGLYPSDPVEALEVDLVIDTVEEAYKFLGYTLTGPKGIFFSEDTLSDQEKIDIRKKLMDPAIPRNVAYFLSVLEKRLDENKSGWFVGDNVTIADIRAHQIVSWLTGGFLDGIPTNCMDTYPLLKALHDKIEALPEIAAFRSKYGKKYTTFDYTPPGSKED